MRGHKRPYFSFGQKLITVLKGRFLDNLDSLHLITLIFFLAEDRIGQNQYDILIPQIASLCDIFLIAILKVHVL